LDWMPELPEVETIRRQLAPAVEGRRLERLEVLDRRWCEPAAPEEVAAAVEGRLIERLSRRGKYLVLELEDEVFLVMHLRMTGNLLLADGEEPSHLRVRFVLDSGERLLFYDVRRFGTGAVVESLQAGIDARGATIDDFRNADGARGAFQDRFLVHLREGEPCPRCGTAIVKLRAAGRGTYVCESCQPRPRARRRR